MKSRSKYKRNLIILGLLIFVAILVFAIGTLSFGIPGTGGPGSLSNPCIAQSGFLCQNVMFLHSIGKLSVSLGQNTGINWTSANFVFVPQGTPRNNTNVPEISFNSYPANTSYSSNGMKYGFVGITKILLSINGINSSVPVGTVAQGTIWVEYITNINQTPQYTEISSVYIKAS